MPLVPIISVDRHQLHCNLVIAGWSFEVPTIWQLIEEIRQILESVEDRLLLDATVIVDGFRRCPHSVTMPSLVLLAHELVWLRRTGSTC